MSSEFAKKHNFKMKRLNRPIYMRNINSIFNQEAMRSYHKSQERICSKERENIYLV